MNQQDELKQKHVPGEMNSSVHGDYVDAGEVCEAVGHVNESRGQLESAVGSSGELNMNRRDLLRLFSLTAAAGTTACIRRPAEKAIPYVNQPVDHIIGVPTYYATTCGGCAAGCGVIAKTKGGRVVKLEGSPKHYINKGGLCALGQGQVQALNHPERLAGPQLRKKDETWESKSWEEVYSDIAAKVRGKQNIGIIMGASTGNRGRFLEVLENMGSNKARLYSWDSNSLTSAMSQAYKIVFGEAILPRIELEKSRMVIGIGSDFQEIGISSSFYTKGFSKTHAYSDGHMGQFIQFESNHSLTGGRADTRHTIPPKSELLTTLLLLKALYDSPGSKGSVAQRALVKQILQANASVLDRGYDFLNIEKKVFESYAKSLLAQPSVVLAGGSANFDESSTKLQLAAILVNQLCGAFDQVIFVNKGWFNHTSQASSMRQFMADVEGLDAVFVVEVDPVSSTPKSFGLSKALRKVPFVVSMQSFPAAVDYDATYALPVHHPLESWGDEQPIAGFWSTRQPVTRPITDSRQSEDIFLWVLAHLKKSLPYRDYRAYLKERWKEIYQVTDHQQHSYDYFYKSTLKSGFAGDFREKPRVANAQLQDYFSGFSLPERGFAIAITLGSSIA